MNLNMHQTADFTPNTQHLTLWLKEKAQTQPDAIAIECASPQIQLVGQTQWTYLELWHDVVSLAQKLQAMGVKAGDKVGILLFNDPLFVVAYFALLGLGVTVIPLNIRLNSDEIEQVLQDAGASGVIGDPELLKGMSPELLQSMAWVLQNGQSPEQGFLSNYPVWRPEAAQAIKEPAGFCDANPVDENPVERPVENPSVLIYTSGTTGKPKGVMLTHCSLGSDAKANAMVIQATDHDTFITISPLFHVFGQVNIMLTAIYCGGKVVLLRKFSPKAVLESIQAHRVTFMAAVPTMYLMMLTHLENPNTAGFDLSSLRVCHSGAAPMAKEVFKRVETAFGAKVQEGYGLSEASSIVTSNPYDGVRKPGSVGLPLPGFLLNVFDENDAPCAVGQIGEIRVKAPMVMAGYYRQPELTEKAFVNGWLKTKDMAYLDEDGYVFIVDRQDDLMNIGGVKVYPREVEEILFQHPWVQAAAVVAVKSALYHEEIKAYVVFKNPDEATSPNWSGLQKFCREHLAEYKIPKHWEAVEEIPQGATGKVLRKVLRQPV
jgi:long-chain acyl-CoA synthetase